MGSNTAAYSQLARCPSSPSTSITAHTNLLKETNKSTSVQNKMELMWNWNISQCGGNTIGCNWKGGVHKYVSFYWDFEFAHSNNRKKIQMNPTEKNEPYREKWTLTKKPIHRSKLVPDLHCYTHLVSFSDSNRTWVGLTNVRFPGWKNSRDNHDD